MTLSFYIKYNGDNDGNRHPIKNDAVTTIWSLSLITPPFDTNPAHDQKCVRQTYKQKDLTNKQTERLNKQTKSKI